MHACDFRLSEEEDMSARVAVCENPLLSIRHVGQRYSALIFDLDTLRVLDREELVDLVTQLAVFIDFLEATVSGPANNRHYKKLESCVNEARVARRIKKMKIQDDDKGEQDPAKPAEHGETETGASSSGAASNQTLEWMKKITLAQHQTGAETKKMSRSG